MDSPESTPRPRPVGWTPPADVRDAVVRSWARVIDDEPPGAWQEADLFLSELDDLGYVVIPKTERDEMLAAYVMQQIR